MKAITIVQPWASLITYGHKAIETRSWPTKYRGKLAIHAGKNLMIPHDGPFIAALNRIGMFREELYPLGAVIGTCELYDCIQVSFSNHPVSDLERLFGCYLEGRYMWMLKDVLRFQKPIPYRGQRGLWNWEA